MGQIKVSKCPIEGLYVIEPEPLPTWQDAIKRYLQEIEF